MSQRTLPSKIAAVSQGKHQLGMEAVPQHPWNKQVPTVLAELDLRFREKSKTAAEQPFGSLFAEIAACSQASTHEEAGQELTSIEVKLDGLGPACGIAQLDQHGIVAAVEADPEPVARDMDEFANAHGWGAFYSMLVNVEGGAGTQRAEAIRIRPGPHVTGLPTGEWDVTLSGTGS